MGNLHHTRLHERPVPLDHAMLDLGLGIAGEKHRELTEHQLENNRAVVGTREGWFDAPRP
jgi:hypothetical protein